MGKLTADFVLEFIKKNNIPLKPTQSNLCLPILNRIYMKMLMGIKFTGIKVANDLIIDGHHRYLASLLAGVPLDRFPSYKTSATTAQSWCEIQFDEEDWDTKAKIDKLNREDAAENKVNLEDFLSFFNQ